MADASCSVFNMPPLKICRPGPGPRGPVRKYGPAYNRHPCPFEPTISAGGLPQTYASDRAATRWVGVGM